MPDERIVSTRSAFPSVTAAGKALHSLYNPVAEAEKFIDSLQIASDIRFFILIECALGYIIPFLRKKNAAAAIISLHASDFFTSAAVRPEAGFKADAEWSPASGRLSDFLDRTIPDIEARYISLIEWRPSLDIYRERYLRILSTAITYIKRVDASKRTTAGFGHRWFINTLKNIRYIKKCVTCSVMPGDCLAAGAGPALEADIPAVYQANGGTNRSFALFAAAAAFPPLRAAGIQPDLVITSDGGNWALLHLYEYIRAANEAPPPALLPPPALPAPPALPVPPALLAPPLAFSLNAALPSDVSNCAVLPLAESGYQAALLEALNIPYIRLMARGTVSAMAIDLALRLSGGKVWTSGMNLSLYGIKTHAKGYRFDSLMEEKASRLSPLYFQRFERAYSMREGGALRIYADYFEQYRKENERRLFPFSAFKARAGRRCAAAPVWTYVPVPETPCYSEMIAILIKHIRSGGGGAVQNELSELLFQDGTVHTAEEIERKAVSLMKRGHSS